VLLHKREIQEIKDAIQRGGFTVIPTRLYFKGGMAKVELAIAKGKKKGDKRQDIAKKTAEREARDEIGRARKGGGR